MHKKLIKRILGRFGYKLIKAQPAIKPPLESPVELPVDLRHEVNGLQAATHYYRNFDNSKFIRPALINAPIDLGRRFNTYPFALAGKSPDPFVFAVKRALQSDNPIETIEETLAAYVDKVRPCDALEALGLEKKDAPLLQSQPPLVSRILPWRDNVEGSRAEILEYVKYWESRRSRENQLHGLAQSYLESGWPGHGMVSKERLQSAAQRLHALVHSIRKDGYRRRNENDGDIKAMILYSNSEWRWVVSGAGNHRAPVLVALGKELIPIRVTQIVAREDVEFWPNVRSGIFSEQGALKIFDSFFNAVLPPVMQKWEDFVKNYGETE